MAEQRRRVKRGGRVVVLVRRAKKRPPLLAPPAPVLDSVAPRAEPVAWGEANIYDLGTKYVETPEPTGDPGATYALSSYREQDHETSATPGVLDLRASAARLIDRLRIVEVAHSGRLAPSVYRLGPSAEADGLLTAVLYEQQGTVRRGDLLGAGDERWTSRVSPAEREAQATELLARLTAEATKRGETLDPNLAAALADSRDRAEREGYETWDAASRGRVAHEGTHRMPLLAGAYRVGVESFRMFEGFRSWDTSTYKVTAEPAYTADVASPPWTRVGESESTRHDIYLAARLYTWQLTWTARYGFFSLFAGYRPVDLPQQVIFNDRLPFFPSYFSYAEGVDRSAAVGLWAVNKRAYNRGLAADRGRESYSPFYFFALESRFDGRWSLLQGSTYAGQLLAVVDSYYQGSPRVRRYVWQAVNVIRPATEIDSGPLETVDITGDPLA